MLKRFWNAVRYTDGNKMKTNSHSVYIVGGSSQISNMFRDKGFHIVHGDAHKKPDIVVFTGGEDVSPRLYGENPLPKTYFSTSRDEKEERIWNHYKNPDVFKVGICRGGQFLNVMNGGAMWQDVNNHTSSHHITDLLINKGNRVMVTSTHHQMMIAGDDGDVLAVAKEADVFRSANPDRSVGRFDTEVVWYQKSKSLCYQPHPEYGPNISDNRKYFFDLIERLW